MGGNMRLRNKKTGEIDDVSITHSANKIKGVVEHEDGVQCLFTYTLKEFNEEWEDYEGPKDFWFIDPEVLIACESTEPLLCDKKVAIETMKQIGNYFDTREEAEKAVEKLKAWKRLKDKGFRFVGRSIRDLTITYSFDNYDEPDIPQMNKDLDLLFGGEE